MTSKNVHKNFGQQLLRRQTTKCFALCGCWSETQFLYWMHFFKCPYPVEKFFFKSSDPFDRNLYSTFKFNFQKSSVCGAAPIKLIDRSTEVCQGKSLIN